MCTIFRQNLIVGGGDPQLEWVYLDSFVENLSIKSSIIIIIITTTLITEISKFLAQDNDFPAF